MPTPGDTAAISALYTATKPTSAPSPYHAFAHCPPTALFGKPPLWPGPDGDATTARLLWDEENLCAPLPPATAPQPSDFVREGFLRCVDADICYECEGTTAQPIDPASVEPAVLAGFQGGAVPEAVRSVLLDERVEAFIWAAGAQAATPKEDQTYYAFECNYGGNSLTNKAQFGSRMNFDWGADSYAATSFEIAVGWGATSSPVPSAVGGMSPPFKTVVILSIKWAAMGIDPTDPGPGGDLKVALHRALWPEDGAVRTHAIPLELDIQSRSMD